MTFKFYSNENFPQPMVRKLREKGYDILTSLEAGQANQGIPDESVLQFAIESNLIIITLNRDDFIKLHQQNNQHNGIVICKADRDYEGQIEALYEYLQTQTTLKNRLIRIKKQNQPKTKKQIFVIQEY